MQNETTKQRNHDLPKLLERLVILEGGDPFDLQLARRSLQEASQAWPGTETEIWWKWIVEAGNSVGQRIRILDGSLDDALNVAGEGARVAFPVDDESLGYLFIVETRGGRFLVESPRWSKPRLMSTRKIRRLLRSKLQSPLRVAFCDPIDLTGASGLADEHAVPPWKRLRAMLRSEWSDIWIVLVFALFVGLLSLATPIAVEALVNTVAFGQLIQPVVILAILLLGFLAFSAAMKALQTWVVEVIQRRLFARVAGDVAYRLPRVSQQAFDGQYGPELVNRFFDVVIVQKISAQLLLDGVALVLGGFIGMAVLAFYHPWLLAFDLLLLAMILLIIFGLGRGAIATSIKESKCKYRMAAWLEELARCNIAFKQDGAPEFAAERADRLTADYLATRKKHFRIVFRQILFALGLQAISSTVLLGLGGWLVINGQLTLGQLVAAELIVTVIVGSFAKLGKHMESFYDLMASVDKLGRLFDMPLEPRHGALSVNENAGTSMQLRHVSAAGLSGGLLDLDIQSGDRLAVFGPAGSGKSTLAALLFGLRHPQGGHVLLDDVDVRDLRPDVLRHHVALVSSIEIFEGTVTENVSLERSDVTLAGVREALQTVGLLDVVMELPDGLETTLYPDGGPLSENQSRRLMLARAIAGQPRLLVIDGLLDAISDHDIADVLPQLLNDDAPWTLVIMTGRDWIAEQCRRRIDLPGLKPSNRISKLTK